MTRRWPPAVAVICCLLAVLASARVAAQQPSSGAAPKIFEYTDNQYRYSFQYPSDWKIQPTPPQGEAGEVRVVVQSATKRSQVIASVGTIGKGLTREQFENSPNRDAAVNAMIDVTVERVYKNLQRSIEVESTIVNQRRALPSDVGIKFYIGTSNIVSGKSGKGVIGVAGTHIIPFGKEYMVNFLMITRVDPKATEENATLTNVFNSFHVVGERPTR